MKSLRLPVNSRRILDKLLYLRAATFSRELKFYGRSVEADELLSRYHPIWGLRLRKKMIDSYYSMKRFGGFIKGRDG
jgi:hypothetical protein